VDEGAEKTGVDGVDMVVVVGVVDAAPGVSIKVVDRVSAARDGMAWPAAARALMTSDHPFSSILILSLSS